MSWLTKQKHKWRAAILVLMIVAFLGPWCFDAIAVPSIYDCEFRLNEKLCGLPQTGFKLYWWFYLGSITELFRGRSDFTEIIRLVIVFLILSCPLLPLLNTALLVFSKKHRPHRVFTVTFWCLAIGAGALGAILLYPKLFGALWGLWLFVGLAVSALGLEILFLTTGTKSSRNSEALPRANLYG